MPAPISKAVWDRIVWHYLAFDGAREPAHSKAATALGLPTQVVRKAWSSGWKPDYPAIAELRKEIVGGLLPFPARPEGSSPPSGGLWHYLRSTGRVTDDPAPPKPKKQAPQPPSPPQPSAAPPPSPDEDGEVDWGDSPLDPAAAAAAIGAVSFPEEPRPRPAPRPPRVPSTRPIRSDRLDSESQAFVDAAQDLAEVVSPDGLPPAMSDPGPPLPSDYAADMGMPLPPLDRELGERLLLESRTDLLDLSARNRRGSAMAAYASQSLMAGVVPLAQRLQIEMVKTAASPEFDVEAGLRMLERALKVARSASGMTASTFVAERHALAELTLHLRSAEPTGGSAAGGALTEEQCLEQSKHTRDRLNRAIAHMERRAGKGGAGDPGAPGPPPPPTGDPAPPAPAAPPEPPPAPPSFTTVLTSEALSAVADLTGWQGGQSYLAEQRVRSLAEDGAALAAVVVGSFEYTVRLWAADGKLVFSCTCPQGQHRPDRGCKHVVAAGLAWLDRQGGEDDGEEVDVGADEEQGEPDAAETDGTKGE